MRLIYLCIGWCAGILGYSAAGLAVPGLWVAIAVALSMLAFFMPRGWRLPVAVLAAAALGAGRMAAVPQESALLPRADRGGLTVEGVVTQPARRAGSAWIIRLAATSVTQDGRTTPTRENLRVRASGGEIPQVGDIVRATGALISPYTFDRFSYAELLERQAIYALLVDAHIELVGQDPAWAFQRGLFAFRDRLADVMRRHLPEPAAGLVSGIVLGDDSTLSDNVREGFSVSGAAHVLAVSGFNMIVLASTVQLLLSRLPVRREIHAILALGVILLYTLMTGATPAILRAALMSALLIVGTALRRKSFLPASLCAAIIVITLLDPNALWDIGLQLSAFTTLALWQFSNPIQRRLERLLSGPRREDRSATVSGTLATLAAPNLAASLAAVPLTAIHFGEISLLAPLVSLLIAPVQPFIMIAGGLGALAGLVLDAAAALMLAAVYAPVAAMLLVVRLAAAVPFARMTTDIGPPLLAAGLAIWIGVTIVNAAHPEATRAAWKAMLARRLGAVTIVCTDRHRARHRPACTPPEWAAACVVSEHEWRKCSADAYAERR
jgi:competence protein ComEC